MSRHKTVLGLCFVLACGLVMTAGAATRYVAHGGQTPSGSFTSWTTAASNIQDAVNVSGNDTIMVSNGLYNAGGTALARVDLSGKAISLLAVSTNPYDTIIDGGGTSRCFVVDTLGTPSLISGFLITNGWFNSHGGGMYVGASYNQLVVTNCIFEGNVVQAASCYGGAVMAYYLNVVILKNCVLRGNASRIANAGGAYQCVLTNDCQVLNNSATNSIGGGLLMCTMYGGLIAGNQALSRAGADRCTLYNVIVSNNMATGNSANGGGMMGGAAYGCSFINNSIPSGYGGGIADASTLASNCLFSGNYAWCGGAASDGAILLNCVVSNNGVSGINGLGGGMYNGGLASNCLFTANTGYFGGAAAQSVTLVDCVISNNRTLYCPGIYWNGTAGSACKAIRCVLIDNTTTFGYGGAAMSCYLTNCLIVKNHAKSSGSGAYNCWLANCTIVSNDTAGVDAAVYGGYLTNCIVWGNRRSGGAINNYEGSPVFAYSCTTPLPAGAGNTNADPQFVDSVGGNYRLAANSPCVNSGTNLDWTTNSYDLDRRTRLRYGTVDMGAYECIYAGSIYVVR